METTNSANPALIEATKNHKGVAISNIHGIPIETMKVHSELRELQTYSSIWGAAIAGILTSIYFPSVSPKLAALAGASIPWVAGPESNYQFHVFLSTLLTWNSDNNTK